MSDTAVAERPTNDRLARVESATAETAAALGFTKPQLEVLKQTYGAGLTSAQFALYMSSCLASGLSPFRNEISATARGKDKVLTVAFHVEGLFAIAQSTGEFLGERGPFYASKEMARRNMAGETENVWSRVWVGTDEEPYPYVLRHLMWRSGLTEVIESIIYFDEFRRLGGFLWKDDGAPLFMSGKRVRGHAFRLGWRKEIAVREDAVASQGVAIAASDRDSHALEAEVSASLPANDTPALFDGGPPVTVADVVGEPEEREFVEHTRTESAVTPAAQDRESEHGSGGRTAEGFESLPAHDQDTPPDDWPEPVAPADIWAEYGALAARADKAKIAYQPADRERPTDVVDAVMELKLRLAEHAKREAKAARPAQRQVKLL